MEIVYIFLYFQLWLRRSAPLQIITSYSATESRIIQSFLGCNFISLSYILLGFRLHGCDFAFKIMNLKNAWTALARSKLKNKVISS